MYSSPGLDLRQKQLLASAFLVSPLSGLYRFRQLCLASPVCSRSAPLGYLHGNMESAYLRAMLQGVRLSCVRQRLQEMYPDCLLLPVVPPTLG